MAEIVPNLAAASSYVDRRAETSAEDQKAAMKTTTTLYVGNLSFFTTEEQIYEIFSKAGEIRRIVMGLDSVKKTPCGFCFVEYYSRKEAEDAMKYINNIKLDDRIIRVDWDRGFSEGRQYGRGKSGGQIRDEYRTDYDPGRGGWGTAARQEVQYDIGSDVPVGEEGGAGGSRKRDYDSQSSGRSRDDYDRKRRRDDNSDNSRKRGRGRGRDDDDSSDDDDRPPRRSRRDSR